ncbi:trihelix transcription factor GTL1 isoform X2 [Cryptomeria japonica]|uniref:trihelix transcription factor GTL1 isoform X2 n=1 Tax=Cryptomeria japonica TaxID=3369 RepID=UPI0027DA04FF|nr:trihelix transcription factor GTL1 isoform X2 [Cryptomeria japonica]
MQQGAAGGGSGQQYGVPPTDVAQFGGGSGSGRPAHGHMLGISHDQHLQQQLLQQSSHKADSLNEISQPPPGAPAAQRSAASFEQLMPNNGGGFGEEEGLQTEDGERGGPAGNRWPRQETLALLKIRSEMDATFRDASLKGPLWEDVSRRLAELGFNRSAKKCKEKFENVHKYYKRTKDGRAGRQDGKSYRFFSQLEALQSSNSNNNHGSPTRNANDARNSHNNNTQAISSGPGSGPGPNRLIPQPCSAPAMLSTNVTSGEMNRNIISAAAATTANPVAVRHSSDFSGGNLSFCSDSSEEDDDYDEQTDSRKRKRASSGSSASTKNMMLFFEQLMKQVMERQEMMQQKFLETIEKREQDRMVREEAWKRQEMARLNREHEIMAQERALSASRDAAFISFLQKITGQTFQGIPTMAPLAQSTTTMNPVPVTHETHEQRHRDNNNNSNNNSHNNNSQDAAGAGGIAGSAEQMDITFDPSSSRWPKPEVHALIRLRSGMEPRYQDAGPKGPLWEEISAGMSRLGYNRSSKRCKEKWENINKYFKKVKESNKKRPEDAKTCPYFHLLDQLYRKRIIGNPNSNSIKEDQQMNHSVDAVDKEDNHVLAIMPPPGPSSDAKNNGSTTTTTNANRPAPGAVIAPTNGTAFYSSPENRTGADHHRAQKKQQKAL